MATDPKQTNANPPATGGDKEPKTEIDELRATNQQLLTGNQQLQTQIDELKGTIISPQFQEFMKVKNQPGQFSGSDFAAGRQEPDLETMDRAQLVQYIMDGVSKTIQGTVAPQIDKLNVDMQRDQLSRGIKDAKGKYPDFDNFAAQMSQTSARIERGGFTAEDIYKITTHSGPSKAGAAKLPDKGDVTEPPTTGGALSAGGKEETPKQIAGRVYDKIYGNKG